MSGSEPPIRSPIHRIVDVLSGSLLAIGHVVDPLELEKWGVMLHQALASRAREFHTHEHVLEMARHADPICAIAALYHDIVYIQVDLGLPPRAEELLEPLLIRDGPGWRILSPPNSAIEDVLAVFGRKEGEVLTSLHGLNELASTMVLVSQLKGVLTRAECVAAAACIELTIPFREGAPEGLQKRLLAMGFAEDKVADMVRRAVRLANRDILNFAELDPAIFLDNTWKLLPETNPSLHSPTTYTVIEYRVALQKMEGFLSLLPPERVFNAWGGEPAPEEHTRRVALARTNLALAVRYLRSKLYSTAMVEALSVATGGDMPLDYFMGGIPEAGRRVLRVEQFLPEVEPGPDADPLLWRLLEHGRSSASSFDLSPSPLAYFLFCTLGEAAMGKGLEDARQFWAGSLDAAGFLAKQEGRSVRAIALAASYIAVTRGAALRQLANGNYA